MRTATWLRIVNPLIFVLAILQFVTAFFGEYFPGAWGFRLHAWGGYVFGIVILVHLALNWNWVRNQYFKKKARPKAD